MQRSRFTSRCDRNTIRRKSGYSKPGETAASRGVSAYQRGFERNNGHCRSGQKGNSQGDFLRDFGRYDSPSKTKTTTQKNLARRVLTSLVKKRRMRRTSLNYSWVKNSLLTVPARMVVFGLLVYHRVGGIVIIDMYKIGAGSHIHIIRTAPEKPIVLPSIKIDLARPFFPS